MRFSREFIDKVISATQLAEVISQYTVLKPAGRDLVGRCPFPDHKEKTPSFHVSPDKQVYHCFGCKKGGNVFTFLQQFQGMSFPEAIEFLAQKASLPLPAQDRISATQESRDLLRRKQMFEINRVASVYFGQSLDQLSPHHRVKEYIHRRYLKSESIDEFQIGYSSEDWEGLARHLQSRGLPLSLAEELGLLKKRDSGGYYDLFRDRLMFTITNPMGEVIGFGGRILNEGQPKYINSPESPLFHKGKTLYGLHQTSRYIRSQDEVIIVEGYMDLIALYQAGIQNVVAPLGTALTLDQCRMLSRITKNVIVLFDGDAAGQNAAERSLPLLFEAGLYPKGLILANGADPDEFIMAQGVEALRTQVAQSSDLFSLILRRMMEGFKGDPTDKVKLVQKIRPLLDPLKDHSLKVLYLREMARRLSVDLAWMQRAILGVQGTIGAAGGHPQPLKEQMGAPNYPELRSRKESLESTLTQFTEGEPPPIDLQGAPKWELLILAMALIPSSNFWDQILHAEETQLLKHEGVREVFKRLESLAGQSGLPSDNFFALIANEIRNPDLLTGLIRDLPSGEQEKEAKLLADCFRKVRVTDLDSKIKVLARELRESATPDRWEQLASLQKDRLRWLNLNP